MFAWALGRAYSLRIHHGHYIANCILSANKTISEHIQTDLRQFPMYGFFNEEQDIISLAPEYHLFQF